MSRSARVLRRAVRRRLTLLDSHALHLALRLAAPGRPTEEIRPVFAEEALLRRTVLGVTTTSGCLHPAQTLASPTQKSRSVMRTLAQVTVRLYTASCWCRRGSQGRAGVGRRTG